MIIFHHMRSPVLFDNVLMTKVCKLVACKQAHLWFFGFCVCISCHIFCLFEEWCFEDKDMCKWINKFIFCFIYCIHIWIHVSLFRNDACIINLHMFDCRETWFSYVTSINIFETLWPFYTFISTNMKHDTWETRITVFSSSGALFFVLLVIGHNFFILV